MRSDRAEQGNRLLASFLKGLEPYRADEYSPLVSLLKHRIIRLWSSLDIDTQIIAETSRHEPWKYHNSLKDILSDKGDKQSYREKLSLLWYMIAGDNLVEVEGLEIKTPCGEFTAVFPRQINAINEYLADSNAIVDLIMDERQKEVQTEWVKLLGLCGLEPQNHNKLFGDITCIPQSAILRFMCYLDCLVQKCQSNEIEDDELGKLPDIEYSLFKYMETDLKTLDAEIQIMDFHQWLNELSETLDSLKPSVPSDDS